MVGCFYWEIGKTKFNVLQRDGRKSFQKRFKMSYPPVREVSREVANLIKRKKSALTPYGFEEFVCQSVCLSVCLILHQKMVKWVYSDIVFRQKSNLAPFAGGYEIYHTNFTST